MKTFAKMGLLAVLCLALCTATALGQYMKMNPPADVDKAFLSGNNSCWLATAANLLGGAGYGTGTNVQARADSIYQQLTAHFGTTSGGWTDVALTWWLASADNVWPNNTYTLVTVHGNKTRIPWNNKNGARFIGNELRRCQFVGLSISWPSYGFTGNGGHAFTAWGDSSGSGTLTANPANVITTDSDTDSGGNVQTYTYDAFTNPNPGGVNNGNGWYLARGSNHPFIKHIATLCPVTWSAYQGSSTQIAIGSTKIHQDIESEPATDLHYIVYTGVPIQSYKTTIDWPTSNRPTITEDFANDRIIVDWDLSDNPIPYCNWVTITTEFVLPRYNSVNYQDLHFTYDDAEDSQQLPAILEWKMTTAIIAEMDLASLIPNVTGGYVIGAFEIRSDETEEVVAEYRLLHEYDFDQNPEFHEFVVTGEPGFIVSDFRFGHSYGYLDPQSLWEFEEWLSEYPGMPLGDDPFPIYLEWGGLLPYPEADGPPIVKVECALKGKIAIVLDVGGRGDLSFNDMGFAGADRAADQFGLQITEVQSASAADYLPNFRNLAKSGDYDLIIGVGFLLGDALGTVAAEYPGQKFAIIDVDWITGPNIMNVVFRVNEMSALIGCLAGMAAAEFGYPATGVVLGIPIPVLYPFEAGYRFGQDWGLGKYSQVADRAAEVAMLYTYTGTFDDIALGKAASEAMLRQGAVGIYNVAGPLGTGDHEAVVEFHNDSGTLYGPPYYFGVDANQDWFGDGYHALASGMKRVDIATYTAVKSVVDCTFAGGVTSLGLAEGGVGISKLDDLIEFIEFGVAAGHIADTQAARAFVIYNWTVNRNTIPAWIWAAVDELETLILSGLVVVPTANNGNQIQSIRTQYPLQ